MQSPAFGEKYGTWKEKCMKICFGCMAGIPDHVTECPYCGFQLSSYRQSENGLKPGIVLNKKYLIGRVLGEGGFGITYMSYDMNSHKKFAVKEYYPSMFVHRDNRVDEKTVQPISKSNISDFKEGMERYVKEAEILSRFFHLPGIVSVKDFFYENGTAYIAMEYVEGISLKEYLKRRGDKIAWDEMLGIMQPLLQSMSVIHEAQIIHRDISPDNIMVGNDGKITLIDFGAARLVSGKEDKSKTVVLKHGYAPIEQYDSRGNQGPWTDIYSLCATMYKMLTGKVPCEASSRMAGTELLPPRKLNRKVPKYLSRAIMKGLEIHANDRFQTVSELYNELYSTRKERRARAIRKFLKRLLSIVLIIFLAVVIFTGCLLYFAYKAGM